MVCLSLVNIEVCPDHTIAGGICTNTRTIRIKHEGPEVFLQHIFPGDVEPSWSS